MKTTLLIMAAGIGSRFGTGIKQLEPVDDAGHIIMDYSIHDAIEAGFNHVVFIIRKDIEKEFKEVIGDRIASICSSHNVTVDYAFQDINDIPGTLPEGRTKPWGTGQAVLAAKDVIKTPFIVINADDYYGKEGFKAVHEYLVNGGKSCMAGFVLKNTLSDNGGVTRGICKMDEQNNLTEVVETKNIVKTATGAETEGKVIEPSVVSSVNAYFITYFFLYAASVLIVSLDNFDFVSNFTAVAATLNNIGPGLGAVGPTCNFGGFSILSKLVLMFDMLAGRLELFPLLLLFSPSTWKKI